MAPDINSLPPSRRDSLPSRRDTSSPSQPRTMHSPIPVRRDNSSPRSSMSLAAAATVNAAERCSPLSSPRLGRNPSDRRRSQVALHLNLNDPTLPSPGETTAPHGRSSIAQSSTSSSPVTNGVGIRYATADPHYRTPSLGSLHNELEQEQEAQVNRMLQLIRDQQLQLDALRSGQSATATPGSHPNHPSSTTNPPSTLQRADSTAIDESDTLPTPPFERSVTFPTPHPAIPQSQPVRRSSLRHRTPSGSPSLHPHFSAPEWPLPSPLDVSVSGRALYDARSPRDETAYYQAETANLTRENQMLRHRIRELEKQVHEAGHMAVNAPSTPSTLGGANHFEMQAGSQAVTSGN